MHKNCVRRTQNMFTKQYSFRFLCFVPTMLLLFFLFSFFCNEFSCRLNQEEKIVAAESKMLCFASLCNVKNSYSFFVYHFFVCKWQRLQYYEGKTFQFYANILFLSACFCSFYLFVRKLLCRWALLHLCRVLFRFHSD